MKEFVAPLLETIEENAFRNCRDLEAIYTPKLKSNQFKCNGCYGGFDCPVCRNELAQCLQKGEEN